MRSLKPNSTRFKVQVIEVPGIDRTARLDWSERFAARFRARSGYQVLVDDEEIRRALLEKGQVVPSFNYSISARFVELGSQRILTFSIQSLETGTILASSRVRGDSITELASLLPSAADALLDGE